MNDNWNHIRKIADSIGSDLDTEAAWARFEQRPERRKRRIAFWWSAGAIGILALFLVLSFFLIGDQHEGRQQVVADQHKEVNTLKTNNPNNVNSDLEQNSTSIALQQYNTPNLKTNENELGSGTKSESQPEAEKSKSKSKLEAKTKTPSQTQSQARLNQVLILQQTRTTSTTEGSLADDKSVVPAIRNQVSNQQVNTEGTNRMKPEDSTSKIESKPIIQTSQGSNSPALQISNQTNPSKLDIPINSDLIQSRTPDNINILPINSTLHVASTSLQIEDYIKLDNRLSEINHKFSKSWVVQARHVYGIASRTLEGDDELFINRRNAQEDIKELNASEVLITRQLTSQFSVSSGLSFGQYRVKLFEVNQEVIQNVVFEDVLLERLFKNGELEELRGTVVGSQTVTTERTRYQHYQDLSIPIYANLHIILTPKLNLIMSTGASISLLNKTQGVTFESAISSGTYQGLNQLNYKSIGLIQGLANLSLSLRLNQQFDIQLGGHLRQDLTSRLKASETSSDRFGSYGFMLGVQRRF